MAGRHLTLPLRYAAEITIGIAICILYEKLYNAVNFIFAVFFFFPFYVLLNVHLSIILVTDQLKAQDLGL